jgi:hypothetical protein
MMLTGDKQDAQTNGQTGDERSHGRGMKTTRAQDTILSIQGMNRHPDQVQTSVNMRCKFVPNIEMFSNKGTACNNMFPR